MAELNIDASLVKSGSLIQQEEKLVEMQNGCICCTLREDLLIEVSRLAASGSFDYLIIESTGISEPQQVAETFELPGPDGESPPLRRVARLDTMVTVVDAANMRANLASVQTLAQREKDEDIAGGERNVAELLLDQIEFANVIILNKIDLVTPDEASRLVAFLSALNPDAEVLSTRESNVDLRKVLNTGRFDMEKASKSPGWLQSLTEQHVPETLEYGIGSFVYRGRRPFHPQRLWKLTNELFAVQEIVPAAEEDDEEDQHETHSGHGGGQDNKTAANVSQNGHDTDSHGQAFELRAPEVSAEDAKLKQTTLERRFGQVLRSKGFFWLAGRDLISGEWSQAGAVLRLGPGGPWYAAMPEDLWENVDVEAVRRDFVPEVGDRRQELVFIGIDVKKTELSAALDACLCTDDEWKEWKTQKIEGQDPFLAWPEFEVVEVEVTDDSSDDEDNGEE
jgi:G3E family GTPase